MAKLMSIEEFKRLQEDARRGLRLRLKTATRIIVGLGTCGIAAGARETMQAVLSELEKRGIEARVTTVGCIGMCAFEPLVDIEQAGAERITYGRVTPQMVPRLIEEHLVNGRIVPEWVVGRLGPA